MASILIPEINVTELPSNLSGETPSSAKPENPSSTPPSIALVASHTIWVHDPSAGQLFGDGGWVRTAGGIPEKNMIAPLSNLSAEMPPPPPRSPIYFVQLIGPARKLKNDSAFITSPILLGSADDCSTDHPFGPETEGVDFLWKLFYDSQHRPYEQKRYYKNSVYYPGGVNDHRVRPKWWENENDVRFVNLHAIVKERTDRIQKRYRELRDFHLQRFSLYQEQFDTDDPDSNRKYERRMEHEDFLQSVHSNPRPDLIPLSSSHPTTGAFQIPEKPPPKEQKALALKSQRKVQFAEYTFQ